MHGRTWSGAGPTAWTTRSVLRAALATGPVREFGRRRPSLTELFRDVVSEEGETS